MQIALEVFFVAAAGLSGGLFGGDFFVFTLPLVRAGGRQLLPKGSNRLPLEEMHKKLALMGKMAYGSNEVDVISRLQQVYLDASNEVIDEEKTAYLLIKTTRQRNKRYMSYLTLCHFKICNMGRKRTTSRYFYMMTNQGSPNNP